MANVQDLMGAMVLLNQQVVEPDDQTQMLDLDLVGVEVEEGPYVRHLHLQLS